MNDAERSRCNRWLTPPGCRPEDDLFERWLDEEIDDGATDCDELRASVERAVERAMLGHREED